MKLIKKIMVPNEQEKKHIKTLLTLRKNFFNNKAKNTDFDFIYKIETEGTQTEKIYLYLIARELQSYLLPQIYKGDDLLIILRKIEKTTEFIRIAACIDVLEQWTSEAIAPTYQTFQERCRTLTNDLTCYAGCKYLSDFINYLKLTTSKDQTAKVMAKIFEFVNANQFIKGTKFNINMKKQEISCVTKKENNVLWQDIHTRVSEITDSIQVLKTAIFSANKILEIVDLETLLPMEIKAIETNLKKEKFLRTLIPNTCFYQRFLKEGATDEEQRIAVIPKFEDVNINYDTLTANQDYLKYKLTQTEKAYYEKLY